MNPTLYVPSGKVPPAIVVAPIVTVLGGVIMGAIYSAITVYVPVVGVVTLLGLVAYGFGLAMLVAGTLKAVKSRNWMADYAIGLFTGFASLYGTWAFFIYFLMSSAGNDWMLLDAFNPILMVAVIYEIGQNGWFEVSGGTPSGMFLYGIWAIEATIIVGAPTVLARAQTAKPFCEDCGVWVDSFDVVLVRDQNLGASFAGHISNWEVDQLMALEPMYQGDTNYHIVCDATCPQCEKFTTVKVVHVALSVDKNNNLKRTTIDVVPPYVVDVEQVALFRAIVVEADAAEQAAQEAAQEVAQEAAEREEDGDEPA